MIISHKYKCILVAIPKTSSTSMAAYLKQSDPQCEEWSKNQPVDDTGITKHSNAKLARDTFGHLNYFSFAVVRNPWARAVSFYEMQRRYKTKGLETTFKKHTRNEYSLNHGVDSQRGMVCDKGEIIVDYVGRYESLDNSLEFLRKKLNLPSVTLPRINIAPAYDYRDYYTDSECRDIIARACSWEIEKFGYSF